MTTGKEGNRREETRRQDTDEKETAGGEEEEKDRRVGKQRPEWRESGREEQRDGEDGEGSAGGAGGEGGEKSDVEGSGPGVGGWFIKCSKVQVEKVRMDLTCLRRR